MAPIRQEMVFIGGTHRLYQAPTQLLLKKAYDPADFLVGKSAPPQIAKDGDFCEIVERVNAPVSEARSNYDLLLVPPLQLPQRYARQLRDFE
jgi:hypothetical protein